MVSCAEPKLGAAPSCSVSESAVKFIGPTAPTRRMQVPGKQHAVVQMGVIVGLTSLAGMGLCLWPSSWVLPSWLMATCFVLRWTPAKPKAPTGTEPKASPRARSKSPRQVNDPAQAYNRTEADTIRSDTSRYDSRGYRTRSSRGKAQHQSDARQSDNRPRTRSTSASAELGKPSRETVLDRETELKAAHARSA